jgi:hypothetical protein
MGVTLKKRRGSQKVPHQNYTYGPVQLGIAMAFLAYGEKNCLIGRLNCLTL